MSGFVPVHQNR